MKFLHVQAPFPGGIIMTPEAVVFENFKCLPRTTQYRQNRGHEAPDHKRRNGREDPFHTLSEFPAFYFRDLSASPQDPGWLDASERPALAVGAMQESAGPGVIRNLPGQGVVMEGLSHDPGDVGQLDQLREWAPDCKT